MASALRRLNALGRRLDASTAWRSFGAATAPAAQQPAARAAAAEATTVRFETVPEAAVESESLASLSNDAVVALVRDGRVRLAHLEKLLGDATRAVEVRRAVVAETLDALGSDVRVTDKAAAGMDGLPIREFDYEAFYSSIEGANCEAVVGYVPIPVGVVGPLHMDGKPYYVPLATTEGALIASANRGARAILDAGGCVTTVTADGMTRAPVLKMANITEAAELKRWVDSPEAFEVLADAFASTSRFSRAREITCLTAGRNVFIRVKAFTGDAMGMNAISKGTNALLGEVLRRFPKSRLLSLSGNVCTDKKPSAINWVNGRGKSVTCEVHLSEDILRRVLKTDADKLIELNEAKNLVGSAIAGSIGGNNAHAANIVAGVFIATGQDPAQVVESSMCMTLFERDEAGTGVHASVTMPAIEVGAVGGGTALSAQGSALDILGVRGGSVAPAPAGTNSATLARLVAASVLSGELSLMAALTSGDLLSAHMALNRKGPGAADAPSDAPAGAEAIMAERAAAAGAGASAGSATSAHTTAHRKAPSPHPHAGPGGGVGAFRVPEASVSPGRRHFAAPSAATVMALLKEDELQAALAPKGEVAGAAWFSHAQDRVGGDSPRLVIP